MKLDISIDTKEKLSEGQVTQAVEIIKALVDTGALWGVRGGKTIINFDFEGVFQSVSFDYIVWKKRK